ncbi:unnamed protein product [Gordionus sp. m RMFG-2023]
MGELHKIFQKIGIECENFMYQKESNLSNQMVPSNFNSYNVISNHGYPEGQSMTGNNQGCHLPSSNVYNQQIWQRQPGYVQNFNHIPNSYLTHIPSDYNNPNEVYNNPNEVRSITPFHYPNFQNHSNIPPCYANINNMQNPIYNYPFIQNGSCDVPANIQRPINQNDQQVAQTKPLNEDNRLPNFNYPSSPQQSCITNYSLNTTQEIHNPANYVEVITVDKINSDNLNERLLKIPLNNSPNMDIPDKSPQNAIQGGAESVIINNILIPTNLVEEFTRTYYLNPKSLPNKNVDSNPHIEQCSKDSQYQPKNDGHQQTNSVIDYVQNKLPSEGNFDFCNHLAMNGYARDDSNLKNLPQFKDSTSSMQNFNSNLSPQGQNMNVSELINCFFENLSCNNSVKMNTALKDTNDTSSQIAYGVMNVIPNII